MRKYIFIDGRIRSIEEEYFKTLGYVIIKLPKCNRVYEEISSHTDIFINKLDNNIIIEKNMYSLLLDKSKEFKEFLRENEIYKKYNIEVTDFNISDKYPNDIALNLCNIDKNVIHNFKYTDKKLLNILESLNYKKININQGYSKCSIAVISDSACITTDKKINDVLTKNNIKTLLVENVDKNIKLLNNSRYSKMHGFIGGCMASIENKIVIFGDINLMDCNSLIKEFIINKNKDLHSFSKLSIIDYGGIVIA